MTDRLDRPILITGTPRSGKSCVGSILSHDPAFAYMGEAVMLWEFGRRDRGHDRLTEADAAPELCARIRIECAKEVAKSGGRRYLDCRSYHAIALPFVCCVLPTAKVIHVIRDPLSAVPEMMFGWTFRDTLSSVIARRRKTFRWQSVPRLAMRFGVNYVRSRLTGRRATWGPRVPGMAEFAAAQSAAETAAFQWQRMTEIAMEDLARLPGDRWIEVRHERLIADPSAEATRIAEFCDVRDPKTLAEFSRQFIDPNFVFERRVEPTEDEWAAIRERVEPLRTRLGYTGSQCGAGQQGKGQAAVQP